LKRHNITLSAKQVQWLSLQREDGNVSAAVRALVDAAMAQSVGQAAEKRTATPSE